MDASQHQEMSTLSDSHREEWWLPSHALQYLFPRILLELFARVFNPSQYVANPQLSSTDSEDYKHKKEVFLAEVLEMGKKLNHLKDLTWLSGEELSVDKFFVYKERETKVSPN
jgi:hypothetical protein